MNKDGSDAKAEFEHILRQEMALLLASPFFSRSPVQSRLLRYLVEHRLAGDLPPPKAYAIATEALGRPADFDASIDSYPRVMVGRLRSLLERYYSEQPWRHRLRIPQGSYEVVVQYRAAPPSRSSPPASPADIRKGISKGADRPVEADHKAGRTDMGAPDLGRDMAFVGADHQVNSSAEAAAQREGAVAGGYDALAALLSPLPAPPDPPQTRWGRWMVWLDNFLPQPYALRRWTMMVASICLAAMLGGGAALLASWYGKTVHISGGERPLETAKGLVPLPLVDVRVVAADAHDSAANTLAASLAARIRDGGRRFEMLSMRSGRRDAGWAGEDVDYLIDVVLTPTDGADRNAAVMVHRLADQRNIWSRRFLVNPKDGPDFSALDPAIAQIAGNYGVIVRDQTSQLADDYREGFPCLAQFQRFRVARQRDAMDKIGACLADNLAVSPRDSAALAAQSYWLYDRAIQSRNDERTNSAKSGNSAKRAKSLMDQAMRQAAAAYAADPSSSHAAFAQARAYFVANQCSQSLTMARRAEDGNGLDVDMLGRLAILYQFCGESDEAHRLSARALMLDQAFPAVAVVARALVLLEQGQPQEALNQLDGLTNIQAVEAHYHVIQAVAFGRLGLKTNAEAEWKRLIALAGMSENARAEDVLRHFRIADIMVRREAMMLQDAGVVSLRTAD